MRPLLIRRRWNLLRSSPRRLRRSRDILVAKGRRASAGLSFDHITSPCRQAAIRRSPNQPFPIKSPGMSIWDRIGELIQRVSSGVRSGAGDLAEAVRTVFSGDPELRRKVAFSVAMIALSAKMAKADGVVTQDEVRAFQEIFVVPEEETRNVTRLYEIAQADIAGFEVYAERMASLCGSGHENCRMLTDILDGLFHIAKADGVLHEREGRFLHRIAEIFKIDERHYQSILARHVSLGAADPYVVLGIEPGRPLAEVKKRYRKLVAENHPDRVIAGGLPQEFVAIATTRLAAINAAYELIEKGLKVL
jgi:DnaJ like chaperone protein